MLDPDALPVRAGRAAGAVFPWGHHVHSSGAEFLVERGLRDWRGPNPRAVSPDNRSIEGGSGLQFFTHATQAAILTSAVCWRQCRRSGCLGVGRRVPLRRSATPVATQPKTSFNVGPPVIAVSTPIAGIQVCPLRVRERHVSHADVEGPCVPVLRWP